MSKSRLQVFVTGVVQGVGFRPFVYRLALDLGLTGYVNNSPRGVTVEVEGDEEKLREFLLRLERERPPRSVIQSLESRTLDAVGYASFEIRESAVGGEKSAWILPDIATCGECRREVFDPSNRRHRYPFTNCTHCGPRFSIILGLPYDRPSTTMSGFPMCPECRGEYEDPLDRRFHAQPNACPVCGPQVQLWDPSGRVEAEKEQALRLAENAVRAGKVLAVKGLGGFHLVCDAGNRAAVRKLRERKQRETKPFAVMFPALDLAREVCELAPPEERLLTSPECPVVLVRRRETGGEQGIVCDAVAPGNPNLGVFLPYTPLHHILLSDLGFPVVATSGNLSEEPICTDESEALKRLSGLADLFLVHNRPIARHVDDSIVRTISGREMVLRRARGYAPMPVPLAGATGSLIATGAHLKNTLAFSRGQDVFVSQHIGDLENTESVSAFRRVLEDFPKLYDLKPVAVVSDLHPDYASSKLARQTGLRHFEVQHHFAHIRACMAENEISEKVLGVAWDGLGLGNDGTLWGGEFLVAEETSFRRMGHLRYFSLAGGEQAVREPRRSALGLLHEAFGEEAAFRFGGFLTRVFSGADLQILTTALRNCDRSRKISSAGRLFDGVASLTGLSQKSRYEGEAAMMLEFAVGRAAGERAYRFEIRPEMDGTFVADWRPVLEALERDLSNGIPIAEIALSFHNGLAEMIVDMAQKANLERVMLSGGCFQNRYLTERTIDLLRAAGFRPYWHQRVPPNDGGISLGQIAAGAALLKGEGDVPGRSR